MNTLRTCIVTYTRSVDYNAIVQKTCVYMYRPKIFFISYTIYGHIAQCAICMDMLTNAERIVKLTRRVTKHNIIIIMNQTKTRFYNVPRKGIQIIMII